jgi:hypothetical protein
LRQFHAHARIGFFTVASTVSEILAAKTRNSAQWNANAEWLKYSGVSKGAQDGENARKNSFLN